MWEYFDSDSVIVGSQFNKLQLLLHIIYKTNGYIIFS